MKEAIEKTLQLRRESPDAAEAGRLYVNRGAISKKLLRDSVYRAWERSHLEKASALAAKAENLSRLETERLIEKEKDLLEAAEPYLQALSIAAKSMRHAAMLSDRNGVLLKVIGDEETIHGPEPFPNEGTLLSEAVAGANGVGTTVAEKSYIELIGHEHFIRGFHPFTCQGIPIFDAQGELAGSISTSVRSPEASMQLRDLFICASHGIEAELIRRRLEKDLKMTLAKNADETSLDILKKDLARAREQSQFAVWKAASGMDPTSSHQNSLMSFLQVAGRSVESFGQQAQFWYELTRVDPGRPQVFSLTKELERITLMLQPEFIRRHVAVHFKEKEEIQTFGYPKLAARKLLRQILNQVELGSGELEISIEQLAAENFGKIKIGSFQMRVPRINKLQTEDLDLSAPDKELLSDGLVQ